MYKCSKIFFKHSLNSLKACRVIQRCLERGAKYQKEDLITLIVGNTIALITNQFGNYVVFKWI